jgi:ABC-type multidrug transport system fused ATPase/permease subunit
MINSLREHELVRVFSLAGRSAWFYFVAALVRAGVLGFSFNLVLAFIIMDVTNAAVDGQQALLNRALILAAVTLFTGVPLLVGASYIIALYEKKALTRARLLTFQQIVDLPIRHFDKEHSGDLLSRCTNDLNTLGRIFSQLVPSLLFGLILGLVGLVSIFVLNWRLGVFALLLGLVTIWASTAMANPLREKSAAIQEALSLMTQRMSDIFQGLAVAKMFHLEETIHQKYAQVNQQVTQATIEHAKIQARYDAINAFIQWMRRIGTLAFGLILLGEGHLELGVVVAAIHLQANASFLFTNLGGFVTQVQRSLAGSARVFEMLSWPKERMQSHLTLEHGEEVEHGQGMIQLVDVSFGYDTVDEAPEVLLDQINISVAPGHFAALVGPSGGGKSTLVKILMGLYPITHGKVFIDGKALSTYPLDELRQLIAYVPQDAYLFDGTIEENIRYGRPDASQEEVIQAARAAYAHDFILDQPEGYQTLVGERGVRLSGGQRQRIAIARALLKDAPILLLDEATSALDSESEAIVQKALEVLMKGRTTIAIAHRLSTIQQADLIYVLKNGKTVEQGTHEELITLGGLYHQLFTLQTRGADG